LRNKIFFRKDQRYKIPVSFGGLFIIINSLKILSKKVIISSKTIQFINIDSFLTATKNRIDDF